MWFTSTSSHTHQSFSILTWYLRAEHHADFASLWLGNKTKQTTTIQRSRTCTISFNRNGVSRVHPAPNASTRCRAFYIYRAHPPSEYGKSKPPTNYCCLNTHTKKSHSADRTATSTHSFEHSHTHTHYRKNTSHSVLMQFSITHGLEFDEFGGKFDSYLHYQIPIARERFAVCDVCRWENVVI